MPEFVELPYYKRPDLSPCLIHLTKRSKKTGKSAKENLLRILREGVIHPSSSQWGFIKGNQSATCFMDVPIAALKQVLTTENVESEYPRYEPYAIVISKQYTYQQGARPVLYLSDDELQQPQIPNDQLWRVVKFDASDNLWTGWVHEREWRVPGAFKLPRSHGFTAALVKTANQVPGIYEQLLESPSQFAAKPHSVIPIQVVCEGLPYLADSPIE